MIKLGRNLPARIFSFWNPLLLSTLLLFGCGGNADEYDEPSPSLPDRSAQSIESSDAVLSPDATAASDHGTRLSGICIVRDETTSLPAKLAPDLGAGYAKQVVPGFHDLAGLKVVCTDEIFQTLLRKHCARENTRVQAGVATYTPDGKWSATTCGAIGCEFLYCPKSHPVSGACVVRNAVTNMPSAAAANQGLGYVRQFVPGVNDLAGLKAACTRTIFQTLRGTYCATQTAPVQSQLVTYKADGSVDSTTCGAEGCDFKPCL